VGYKKNLSSTRGLNGDFFYFTGSIQRGIFYLPAEGKPVYLVIKDYRRVRMESGLHHILKNQQF
jgi:Xaa-Pro dipeptidase